MTDSNNDTPPDPLAALLRDVSDALADSDTGVHDHVLRLIHDHLDARPSGDPSPPSGKYPYESRESLEHRIELLTADLDAERDVVCRTDHEFTIHEMRRALDARPSGDEALRAALADAADWIDTAASNERPEAYELVDRLRALAAPVSPSPDASKEEPTDGNS